MGIIFYVYAAYFGDLLHLTADDAIYRYFAEYGTLTVFTDSHISTNIQKTDFSHGKRLIAEDIGMPEDQASAKSSKPQCR